MSLSDVSGVFSRYFIVGFFVPTFFALLVLDVVGTRALQPEGYDLRTKSGVLVLGGAALLIGLLLLGLAYPVVRLFEGYFLDTPVLDGIRRRLIERHVHAYTALDTLRKLASEPAATDEELRRGISAWSRLDWSFPDDKTRILPTRFGNAMRAFEFYSYNRWGLDPISTWSRIEPLLSEQEQELHSSAKTDVAFCLNACLLALVAGTVLLVNAVVDGRPILVAVLLFAVAVLTSFALYRLAVGAAQRWGVEVRASVDLHRLELYDRLGLRRPTSFTDERTTIAPNLNRFFLYAEPLPDDLFEQPGHRPISSNASASS